MSDSGIVPKGKGEITQSALILKPGITFEQWQAMGENLGAIAKSVMFWIGDWINYGESAFGEKYAQAMDITGYSYRTVKQAKYIAKKFPPEERDERLTFTHYTAVAGEPPEKARQLLNEAIEQDLTVEELKLHRKGGDVQKKREIDFEGDITKGDAQNQPGTTIDNHPSVVEQQAPQKGISEPQPDVVEVVCPHCNKPFDVEV